MKINPGSYKNGKVCGIEKRTNKCNEMEGGIISGDRDLANSSRSKRNRTLQSIGGTIEEMKTKMKGKSNLTI
tara:strand:- start:177 stop:392 length:216 start_codon:yes stop_codon:yes gene_type:complete